VVSAPVPALTPARPPAPTLPTPVAPPAPAVPTPPATSAPQPTPEPVPAAPAAPEAQLATVATVRTGPKKTTGRDDKSAVPSRGSQLSPTPGPVRPTLDDGEHGDEGSSKPPKLDSSEQRANGDRHDKHKGD